MVAIQIVMDRTGDSRRRFDPNDARELGGAALPRADWGRVHRRYPDRSRPGLPDPILRSECGRNGVLPKARRRLIGQQHAAHQTASNRRTLANESGQGPLHQTRRRGHAGRPIAAALAGMALAMLAPRRTSASSAREAVRSWGCVSCRLANCRSATSCWRKRSLLRTPKATCSRWPEDSSRTDSCLGERGFFG